MAHLLLISLLLFSGCAGTGVQGMVQRVEDICPRGYSRHALNPDNLIWVNYTCVPNCNDVRMTYDLELGRCREIPHWEALGAPSPTPLEDAVRGAVRDELRRHHNHYHPYD